MSVESKKGVSWEEWVGKDCNLHFVKELPKSEMEQELFGARIPSAAFHTTGCLLDEVGAKSQS